MLPLLLALCVFFADCVVAAVVYLVLSKRGHPLAKPIAGFIVLAGIASGAMIYLNMPAR